jgi:hypothetical protein
MAAMVVIGLTVWGRIFIAEIISNIASQAGPFDEGFHSRIVIYSGSGISIFFLFNSLELYLAQAFRNSNTMSRFSRLLIRVLQWSVILLFGDIVLQNFKGRDVTLTTYFPSYQCIGGMIAIIMYLFSDFFHRAKKSGS